MPYKSMYYLLIILLIVLILLRALCAYLGKVAAASYILACPCTASFGRREPEIRGLFVALENEPQVQ